MQARFILGDCGISIGGTVLYPVLQDYGKCGCGKCDMHSSVAYFADRADAIEYIRFKNAQVTVGVM